jgi:hypothetical protein
LSVCQIGSITTFREIGERGSIVPWKDIPPDAASHPVKAAVLAAPAISVKRAQMQLQSLQNKSAAAQQRKADLEAEREQLAFAAHGAGDRVAKKRLGEIHLEIATHDSESASIMAAISAGEKNLAEAHAAERRAAKRADAERAVAIANEMAEAGQLVAEAVTALSVRIDKFEALAAESARLGFGASPNLIASNMRRSLGCELPLGLGQVVPSSQRVELGALLHGYASRALSEARAALTDDTGKTEAAA